VTIRVRDESGYMGGVMGDIVFGALVPVFLLAPAGIAGSSRHSVT